MSTRQKTPPADLSREFSRDLLRWFKSSARSLPWRENRTAYRVWLSEIMLQQTQVKTVVPYYERFLDRWPDVCRLADAPLDEVLRVWEGLGYYSRARNLHRAAQVVARELNGEFPRSASELQKLPGIGAYTAGAIASLTHNEPVAAVDGNVIRVFSRLKGCNLSSRKDRSLLESEILRLQPSGQAGLFNEALMELGATLCTPAKPDCTCCPVRRWCGGFASGHPEKFPPPAIRTAVKEEHRLVAVITDGKKLYVRQNSDRGIFARLWEFPSVVLPTASGPDRKVIVRWIFDAFQIKVRTPAALGPPFRHRLTHRLLTFWPYRFKWAGGSLAGGKWLSLSELDAVALAKPYRQIAQIYGSLRS